MPEFRRGLGGDFRNCLKEKQTPWWEDVKEHRSLAIAIRYKYLNVYSKGQSIFKVTQKSGSLVAETHYKYLLDKAQPEYRFFRDNAFGTKGLGYITKYEGTETLDRLIRNASVYAGDEKKHVHSILGNNGNIIDVEVAFTTLLKDDKAKQSEERAEKQAEKSRVDRIDLVALEEKSNGSISIVFYEVKTFNDPRIRARENAEVIGQLNDYKDAINQAKDDIKKAYAQVCRDLKCLERSVGGINRQLDPLISKAARDDITLNVDLSPRLVIVGYDQPQWENEGWLEQLERLKEQCGEVIHAGNGTGVRLPRGPDKATHQRRGENARVKSKGNRSGRPFRQ